MQDEPATTRDRKENQDTIRRLADAVGCSVEAFSDPRGHEFHQALELLSAWLAIRSGPDREKVLSLSKSLASRA